MIIHHIHLSIASFSTFIVLMMTAITSDRVAPASGTVPTQAAFALIPAQVSGVKHRAPIKLDRSQRNAQTQRTQEANCNQFEILSDDDSAGDTVVYNAPTANATADSSSERTETTSDSAVKSKVSKNKAVFARYGNLPDVHWRAIPMTHLRSHPNFKPLPPSTSFRHLPTKEHVRYFRQESWQWDYLHQGRCTTSQAAAALGFLEPQAANFLGIPKTLQKGGGGAWHRLRQDSSDIDELEEMERILCEGRALGVGTKDTESVWIEASKLKNKYPFVAKYKPTISEKDLIAKKIHAQQQMKHSTSSMSTRMHWGNAQEATSILTAINFFCGNDDKTTIHEVGMCGAAFDDVHDSTLCGLKIGASPDAIICHGNGTVEVLEVKNHCPFAWNRFLHRGSGNVRRQGKKKKGNKQRRSNHGNTNANDTKLFGINDFDLECKVPAVYIPQLMMEMFCVGTDVDLDKPAGELNQRTPICKSAVMIRQTATRGAIVLRLHRDEDWISEMKYFLGEFKKRYVDAGIIPPDDFFWDDGDASRYNQFLRKTKELSESVEQIATIEHGRIQRVVMNKGASYETPPLFLDGVEII